MAQPTTSTFKEFAIHLGNGATPTEVFTFICGLTSKGLSINNNTSTTPVPDCDDEDLPAFEEADVSSQAVTISGSGIFARENQKTLLDWAMDGSKKNIRVYPGRSAAGDVEYYQGPAILTSLEINGERGQRVQASLSISFARKPTETLKT
jgi:predicted secreted protein